MAKCPYANRECTPECKAFDESKEWQCLVMHFADRTNKLLNFIEKKLDSLTEKKPDNLAEKK